MGFDRVKSSFTISGFGWRAMVTRFIITLFLLAAVLKIGS